MPQIPDKLIEHFAIYINILSDLNIKPLDYFEFVELYEKVFIIILDISNEYMPEKP